LTALAESSINGALGGPGTQHKVAERLSIVGLTSAFAPYLSLLDSEELRFGTGEDVVCKFDGSEFSVTTALGTVSGEKHGMSVVVTGTMASGTGMVGGNFAVTTAGTAAAWVSGIYAKVTQGATKNVNGYISGAEFEVINTAANVSDWFVLVLNANSSYNGSHSSYIALRDYGGTALNSMFWFGDASIGSASDTALLSTVSGQTHSHALRFIVSGTPYWVECTNIAPSTGYINHKTVWTIPAAAISGEEHGLSLSYTGTLSSGDSLVGANFAVSGDRPS